MNDPGVVLSNTLATFTNKLVARQGFKLPRQRYIQVGGLAYDCEALVVGTVSIYQGSPGQQRPGYQTATGGLAMYAMDVGVSLLRTVPVSGGNGAAPTGDTLTRASLAAIADGKALTETWWAAADDDSIVGACDTIYYGGVRWLGPQGGFIETQLLFSVQI